MLRRLQTILETCIALLFVLAPVTAAAAGYWETDVPIMGGAANVKQLKDRDSATIQASYDLLVEDHKAPLKFYGSFFESAGWKHHMSEVFEKFPNRFERPPGEDWSSFSASSQDGTYRVAFASMWQNKTTGANATLRMTLSGIEGNAMKARIDVVIAPPFDGSPFLELFELTKDDPRALLRLAAIAGGDPFRLEDVNMQKVRSVTGADRLTSLYVKAVDSIKAQIAEFLAKHGSPR